MGLRPGYRGYFIEARYLEVVQGTFQGTDRYGHWVFIVYDITGGEVDRFTDLDEVKKQIDDWVEGSVR